MITSAILACLLLDTGEIDRTKCTVLTRFFDNVEDCREKAVDGYNEILDRFQGRVIPVEDQCISWDSLQPEA